MKQCMARCPVWEAVAADITRLLFLWLMDQVATIPVGSQCIGEVMSLDLLQSQLCFFGDPESFIFMEFYHDYIRIHHML